MGRALDPVAAVQHQLHAHPVGHERLDALRPERRAARARGAAAEQDAVRRGEPLLLAQHLERRLHDALALKLPRQRCGGAGDVARPRVAGAVADHHLVGVRERVQRRVRVEHAADRHRVRPPLGAHLLRSQRRALAAAVVVPAPEPPLARRGGEAGGGKCVGRRGGGVWVPPQACRGRRGGAVMEMALRGV